MNLLEKLGVSKYPWSMPHFAADIDCNCGYIFDGGEDCKTIGELYYTSETKYCEYPSLGTAKANARLITAAPEMLHALIDYFYNDFDITYAQSFEDRVKKIIESATGKTWEEIQELLK